MSSSSWKSMAIAGSVVGASTLVGSAAASAAVTYFARRVVTPDRHRPSNVEVRDCDDNTVTLTANALTLSPGQYGLFCSESSCHARLGSVLSQDVPKKTVVRELVGVDYGAVRPGPGRWNGYYLVGNPHSACDLRYTDMLIESSSGDLPAWFIPGGKSRNTDFAVCVHGRGATRSETLRALPTLHRLGFNTLVPSYRNSVEGPRLGRGQHHLGQTEWEDVEAVFIKAREMGAERLVLLGWSMGAAIVLQAAARSWAADLVTCLVLDSPVLDWSATLQHNAKLLGVPASLGTLSVRLLSDPWAPALVGTDSPLDFATMNWVERAADLAHPTLIIHSDSDRRVPTRPSLDVAHARPDLVTYREFPGAGHVQGWNTNPRRWEKEVSAFIRSNVSSP